MLAFRTDDSVEALRVAGDAIGPVVTQHLGDLSRVDTPERLEHLRDLVRTKSAAVTDHIFEAANFCARTLTATETP